MSKQKSNNGGSGQSSRISPKDVQVENAAERRR